LLRWRPARRQIAGAIKVAAAIKALAGVVDVQAL
jgi:hypothetical protein